MAPLSLLLGMAVALCLTPAVALSINRNCGISSISLPRSRHLSYSQKFSTTKLHRLLAQSPESSSQLPSAAEPARAVDAPIKSSPGLTVEGPFVLLQDPEPQAAELTNQNMLRILLGKAKDEDVNTLVWKCLGYRPTEDGAWGNDKCFPKWREKFPGPPDFIGLANEFGVRDFSKEVDQPRMKANQALVRSVPMQFKQSIREHLRPEGFMGYSMDELTPTKTRRAQCANWLLYYREQLFGVSLEELIARKELERNVAAENEQLRMQGGGVKIAAPEK